jgi:hypothetical protein
VLVIQRPDGWLCDREALAIWLKRSVPTIRRHCPVAAYTSDGRALYNMEHCDLILAYVPTRQRRAS